ncbi:MAG: hypothetical protein MUO63_14875 [Desulfobulbaceae bacterium]|nr:hypothetical protein [Desulfobulbaceae bacterium]
MRKKKNKFPRISFVLLKQHKTTADRFCLSSFFFGSGPAVPCTVTLNVTMYGLLAAVQIVSVAIVPLTDVSAKAWLLGKSNNRSKAEETRTNRVQYFSGIIIIHSFSVIRFI